VTFTKDFSVPDNPQGGLLTIAADNTATVTVNGTQVTDFVPGNGTVVNSFHSPSTADITSLLVTGPNEIAITGTNVGNAPAGTTLNPAGILASVSVTLSLTSTDLCKDGGWQNSSPTFTNQGDCVSYVVSHSPSSA
jgi:uncharacterized repeat protein (TIGR01451 family)